LTLTRPSPIQRAGDQTNVLAKFEMEEPESVDLGQRRLLYQAETGKDD
jgi:hypothetical protein